MIVLLLMVVLMTVGLSLATRTTEELFLSNQQAESTRVFNAAESGVEDALSQDFSTIEAGDPPTDGSVTIADTDVNYTITGSNLLETYLEEGKSVLVNLDDDGDGDGDVTGQIRVFWWHEDNWDCASDPAALIVSRYYDDGTETKSQYHPIGSCDGGSRGDDFFPPSFTSATYTIDPDARYRYDIDVTAGTEKFLRIKAVYNNTHLTVAGVSGATLPTQHHIVRSTATNQLGDETRTVEVKRTLSTAPSFMEYAVYTPGSLQH